MPSIGKKYLKAWVNRFETQFSITRKISFGYFVAIGLGFMGTIAGLVFADYVQGQGVQRLMDAQQQSQILSRFQIAAAQIQRSGLRLATVADSPKQLQLELQQLQAARQAAKKATLQLEQFLARDPTWLAANDNSMQVLLRNYLTRLEDYATQVERVLKADPDTALNPTAAVQQELLAIAKTEQFADLTDRHENLLRTIQTAQLQELQGGEEMESAQGWEKLIIVLSAISSVAIAGAIAFYTTRSIVRPLQQMMETARKVTQDADFSLQLAVESEDEVGALARSFNRLIQWIDDYTQELTQTVAKLRQTQTQLIQTEKMSSLGQMVAGIAHEINNPVSFIHANLEPLAEYTTNLLNLIQRYDAEYPTETEAIAAEKEEIDFEFLQADLPKVLAAMEVGTTRIREIVLSMRNFSRQDEAELQTINLHEGLETTLLILRNRLKVQAKRPEIQIVKEYGQLPPIKCYGTQLNQVFLNLISNAIDALEPGAIAGEIETPTIRIRTVLKKKQAIVCIADNGPGMSAETRRKIFDPFFTTKAIGKGTGLGLSISYSIVVEHHGGELSCFSAPGQGTEFIAAIPIEPI